MARHHNAFRRVDNPINEAVVTGSIVQVPGFTCPNCTHFKNVQSRSTDGNGNVQHNSAFYMLNMAYDTSAPHINNTTNTTGCIAMHPRGHPLLAVLLRAFRFRSGL
jgi:hypothetical protein